MQPEELLTRLYEGEEPKSIIEDAAAELRRLHEANEQYKQGCERDSLKGIEMRNRITALEAANAELLEALQACRAHMYEHASNTPDGVFDKLCAALAKHGGAHD